MGIRSWEAVKSRSSPAFDGKGQQEKSNVESRDGFSPIFRIFLLDMGPPLLHIYFGDA